MNQVKLKWWWYIMPAYLTVWTLIFSFWNLLDGEGMMESFGIDTGGASQFIMLNSASRYLAIAVGMVVGIWFYRTYHSIMLALIVRLSMDLLDLYSGIEAEIILDILGVLQSLFMFIIPNLLTMLLLIKHSKSSLHKQD